MAKIESQSVITGRHVGSFFVPSWAAVTLYLLIGAISLAVFNLSSLLNALGANYLGPTYKLSLNIHILNNSVSKSLGSAFGGRLGQIVVWSLVGALTYILLWFLKNILNSFENDVIIGHYRHPSNFSRAGYWGSAVAGIIFFGAIAIVLAVYSYIVIKVIMPAAAALASSAVHHFSFPSSPGYLLLCLLIPTVAVYLWTLLARIFARLWGLL